MTKNLKTTPNAAVFIIYITGQKSTKLYYFLNFSSLKIQFNSRFKRFSRSLKQDSLVGMGPSIKYVTLFLMIFDPLPCHKLSHFLRPSPPWSVTYFMDGPYVSNGFLDFENINMCRRTQCYQHLSSLRNSAGMARSFFHRATLD